MTAYVNVHQDTVLVEFWAGVDPITRSDLMFEGAWGARVPF